MEYSLVQSPSGRRWEALTLSTQGPEHRAGAPPCTTPLALKLTGIGSPPSALQEQLEETFPSQAQPHPQSTVWLERLNQVDANAQRAIK